MKSLYISTQILIISDIDTISNPLELEKTILFCFIVIFYFMGFLNITISQSLTIKRQLTI